MEEYKKDEVGEFSEETVESSENYNAFTEFLKIETQTDGLISEILKNNSIERIRKVVDLGILFDENSAKIRGGNAGKSDYPTKIIQPWAIFQENPQLLYQEDDIIKRVLRTKEEGGMTSTEARLLDIQKIIHNAQELERIYKIKLRNEQSNASKD